MVVGSGESLYYDKLGHKIDEFDEVIRFNECRLVDCEDIAGSKFTIWVHCRTNKRMKKFIDSHKSRGWDDDKLLDVVSKIKEIWYISNKAYINDGSEYINTLKLNNTIKRCQNYKYIKKFLIDNQSAHTGYLTLRLLSETYDRIYIAGFDFFGAGDSKLKYWHYWDIKDIISKDVSPLMLKGKLNPAINEKRELERNIIGELIKQNRIIPLKRDTIIEKSKLIDNGYQMIVCNRCKHHNLFYNWEVFNCGNCGRRVKSHIKRVVAYIPIKSESERLPNKNTRLFCGKPLYTYIIENAINSNSFNDIYIDTDSEEIKKYARQHRLNVIDRPKFMTRNNVNGNDLLLYDFNYSLDGDYIFQLFVTSPLLKAETIKKCVDILKKSKVYDSIFTVTKESGWFWLDRNPINYRPNVLPRSQDAIPLLKESTGLYGITKKSLLKYKCRIGAKPKLFEIDKYEGIDIDTKDDFVYAEYVYENIINHE